MLAVLKRIRRYDAHYLAVLTTDLRDKSEGLDVTVLDGPIPDSSNLLELIAEKQFRDDLYYRLSMVEIELPRLADRREDLPLLHRFFIEQFAAQYGKPIKVITPRAQIVLGRYSWPGNIRELRSVLGSACMMAEGELIDVRDLPERIRARAAEAEKEDPNELLPLAEIERRHVLRVLEQVGGNKVQAAKILG